MILYNRADGVKWLYSVAHSCPDTALVFRQTVTDSDTFLQMWLITHCFGQLVNESDSNLHALITVNYTEEGTAQRFN